MDENNLARTIGGNVAKYRNIAGMTQVQLAERVGVSTAFISRVERGQKMMKVHTLYATAQALTVSCDALICQERQTASFENIKKLLNGQPSEYLVGIEKLIRVCAEEFEPKRKFSSDL